MSLIQFSFGKHLLNIRLENLMFPNGMAIIIMPVQYIEI